MMWGYGLNWLSMTLMILGSILGMVLLVVLVWGMIRWLNHRMASPGLQAKALPGSGPTAIAILGQRYARGEIDATTFEQMRARLETSDHANQRGWAEERNPVGERLFDGE